MFNRYREVGLSLIPIEPGEKRPWHQLTEWSQFCERLPTESECDAWERLGFDRYGLACGPASGVMAVDIDSDDVKVISAVKPSPVRKRGKKGETRFFRYSSDVPSCKVAGIIDILACGRQTIMPPSIHPETKQPYLWLTPDTLDQFPVADLPEFTATDLEDLRRALHLPAALDITDSGVNLHGPFYNDDPKRQSPHGSQDRLKRVCNAQIARGASPDEAVRELLRYDEEMHKPVGYFFEVGRTSDQVADPVTNAICFYAANLKTFNRRAIREQGRSIAPLISGSEILEVAIKETTEAAAAAPAFKPMEWPEPQGSLLSLKELISKLSVRHQPGIALGGAIAIGSVVVANKLKLGDNWPNVYVLNVAPTGGGKSFPYTVAKRILTPENGLDFLGSGGFRSSAAIIKDIVSRKERIDLIDEVQGTFRTMRDGGVFQQDMTEILNSLWSDSNSSFLGPEAAGKEKVATWNPCISILMSTTPSGLKGSIDSTFVAGGFLPRCLIFHDSEYGKIKKEVWDPELAKIVIERFQKIQAEFGKKEPQGPRNIMLGPRPNPDPIPVTDEAQARLHEFSQECAKQLAEPDREEVERHFLSRGGQLAARLALIHGALWRLTVGIEDVTWAIETLRASWHNATDLLPTLGAENLQEKNVIKVLQIIRKAGQIPHAQLIQKTRFLRTSERNEILAGLEAEGRVRPQTVGSATKKGKTWTLVS